MPVRLRSKSAALSPFLCDSHNVPEQPKIVYDIATSFSRGINSGIAVEELPKNQAAFAVNTTFRGDYATDRAPVRRVKLDSTIDALLQDAFKQGLFQGGGSYKPDFVSEVLVCSIAGRQFTILPSADPTIESTGTEITIPGDSNPPNIAPVWFTQAEQFGIWQDGQSIPLIYDGTSQRRSEVKVTARGVISAAGPYPVPPINGTVDVVLNAAYTGLLNSVLRLDEVDASGNVRKSANYMVTKVGGNVAQYEVVLKNLSANTGTTYSNGNSLVVQPSNLGKVVSVTLSNGKYTTTLTADIPKYAVKGMSVLINNNSFVIASVDKNFKFFSLTKPSDASIPAPIVGQSVTLKSFNAPNVTVGVLESTFAAPAVGASGSAFLIDNFTYPNGTILFIGNDQFEVISSTTNPPASNTTVTLQNLNDIADLDPVTNTYFKIEAGSTLYNLPEIPIGRMGAYGMGRVWLSLQDGITYIGGDIVNGSSGSPAYAGRDAVLKVVENTHLANGGTFNIPSSGDTITAMLFTATMDKALGQGPLQVFTNRNVFSCNTPTDRTLWANLVNPIETQSLKGAGASSQWATINENADILFRSPNGLLRSMLLAQLNFNKWGNTPISHEIERVIVSEDDDFMNFCSAITFDNRWLITSNPSQGANGVFWQGLIALNLDNISSLQEKSASIYDGLWTGLNILQIVKFNSVDRAFAFCVNTTTNELEIWEFLPTGSEHFDDGKIPIPWAFETPAFFLGQTAKNPGTVLKLENGAISVRDIIGEVVFKVQYRADEDSCWRDWHSWKVCAKQSTDTTVTNPQYRRPMSFGKPNMSACNTNTDMPINYGDFFQVRVEVLGHCIATKIRLMASLQPIQDFTPPLCKT